MILTVFIPLGERNELVRSSWIVGGGGSGGGGGGADSDGGEWRPSLKRKATWELTEGTRIELLLLLCCC